MDTDMAIHVGSDDVSTDSNLSSDSPSSVSPSESSKKPVAVQGLPASQSIKSSKDGPEKTKKQKTEKKKKQKQQKEELTAKQVASNRTSMALFYFSLSVPRYSISLFFFLAHLIVPLNNISSMFERPWERMMVFVRSEADLYERRIVESFPRTVSDLSNVANAERHRSREAAARNRAVLKTAMSSAFSCYSSTKLGHDSLLTWERVGNELPLVMDPDTCSMTNHTQLREMLGNNIALVESSVSEPFDSFADSGRSSLGALSSYSKERASYDTDYFIVRRIEPALKLINKALQNLPNDFKAKANLVMLWRRIRSVLDNLRVALDEYRVAAAEFDDLIETIEEALRKLQKQYQKVFQRCIDMYLFLDDILDKIPSFAEGFLNVPDDFKINDLAFPDDIFPDLNYPSLPQIPDTSKIITQTINDIVQIVTDMISNVELQANLEIGRIRGVEVANLSLIRELFILDDYDPPKYVGSQSHIQTVEEEEEYYEQMRAEARGDLFVALGGIGSFSDLDDLELDVTMPDIDTSDVDIGDSTPVSFEYLELRFPSFKIPDFLMKVFMFFVRNSVLLETCFHGFRLLKVVATYWRGGTPYLPEIDYSIVDKDDVTSPPQSPSIFQQMGKELAASFTSTRMVLLLLLSPICITSLVFWSPYLDEVCVPSGNGTAFANGVMVPHFVNQANAAGNRLYGRHVAECETFRRGMCNALHRESDRQFRSDIATLQTAHDSHMQVLTRRSIMISCVDNGEFVAGQQNSCCGLPGYDNGILCEHIDPTDIVCPLDNSTTPAVPFEPLYHYLDDAPGCDSPLLQSEPTDVLEDSRFNCEVMSGICSMTMASSVDEELIRRQAIRTDCEIQSAMTRCLRFLVAAILHAVCINVILTIFFGGYRRVNWRKVSPGGIAFTSRVHEWNGKLIGGSNHRDRMAYISSATWYYSLTGKALLVLSALMFGGWLYVSWLVRAWALLENA